MFSKHPFSEQAVASGLRLKADSRDCGNVLAVQTRIGSIAFLGGMPMATISDVSIINWNTAEAKPVASGFERTICSQGLCGSRTLTVYQRTVLEGHQFDVQAGD